MISLLVAAVMLSAEGRPSETPPLTREQAGKIQKLVIAVKAQDEAVKRRVVSVQKELVRAYADYDLDERRITGLQDQIAELQRDLLKNYHRLQLELRRIVGPERFQTVKLRVDLHVRSNQTPPEREGGE